jgi:hypothetical protein
MTHHPIEAIGPERQLDQAILLGETLCLHVDDFQVAPKGVRQVLDSDQGVPPHKTESALFGFAR